MDTTQEINISIEDDILDDATKYKLLYIKTTSELLKSQINNLDFSIQNLKREGESMINKLNENERKLDMELDIYCSSTFNKSLKEVSEDYVLDLDLGKFTKKNK